MLAVIEKNEGGYVARYDRPLKHSVEKVWSALTENDKLAKWMPNLQVEELRKGGTIKFDMKDGSGTFIDIEILDFQQYSVLEYTWGSDRVRFELYPKPDGCLLARQMIIHQKIYQDGMYAWMYCLLYWMIVIWTFQKVNGKNGTRSML